MNVEAGDRARIVHTGTLNDGALVDVLALDPEWSASEGKPIWVVQGVKLLGIKGRMPSSVQDGGLVPDRNLRKVAGLPGAVDKRTRLDLDEPTDVMNNAAREAFRRAEPTSNKSASEIACPTT